MKGSTDTSISNMNEGQGVLKELIHTFNIIQHQLCESNEQQREIIRKVS